MAIRIPAGRRLGARPAPALVLAALPLAAVVAWAASAPGAPSRAREPGRTGAPAGPRDVLLITIDTLRWDATGFSGAGKARTPAFDRIAASGRVFASAHAHAVVTLPSHASILTGLYPYQHGIRDIAGFVLRADVRTLASMLREAGFATGAFVSASPLDARFGLNAGFDVYDDQRGGRGDRMSGFAERPGRETVARALAWWNEHSARRRFLWVHLFAPHWPYEPEEPFRSRHASAPYYGDVEMADAELGPLVDPILAAAADRTLIVFTSDHGEALGEHGEKSHGLFAYEATLRVPLVVRMPGSSRRGTDPGAARHVDIVPTVLDALGLKIPSGLPGRSLLAPPPKGADSGSYFEALSTYYSRGWAPLAGRIEGTSKAIRLPIPELYRLDRDPSEIRNLCAEQPEAYRSITSKLPETSPGAAARQAPSADVVERLRSLGYLAGDASPPPAEEFDASRDPKRLVDIDSDLEEAAHRYRAGDVEGAIRGLRSILDRVPRMALAYSHLALILAERGRNAEAVAVLSKAVSLGIASEPMQVRLALGLVQTGKPQDAWDLLARYRDSRDPETQWALGKVAAARGQAADARAHFRKALELDASFPQARIDLAALLLMQGSFDEAKPLVDQVLREDPSIPDAWNALGVLRSREGDLKGAIDAWERALAVYPRLPSALFNLAVAAGKTGDYARGVQAIERLLPMADPETRRTASAMLEDYRRRLEARDPSAP